MSGYVGEHTEPVVLQGIHYDPVQQLYEKLGASCSFHCTHEHQVEFTCVSLLRLCYTFLHCLLKSLISSFKHGMG